MKQRGHSIKRQFHSLAARTLSLALCAALALALLPNTASAAAVQPTASKNINNQAYGLGDAATPVRSYLFENSSGGLTRVEYTGRDVIVEDYDSLFRCQASRTIPKELSLWGGFFAGENYNFFVFAQRNDEEDKNKEVFRVVKYTKDWQRLGSVSLYGENTKAPFYYGTLRCAEYGGYLYVRTCHSMFKTKDGKNHQANMMFSVRQSDMTVTDSFTGVTYASRGYVSHSMNQFVIVDQDQNIVTLDHGDSYPAAIVLFRYNIKAGKDIFLGGSTSKYFLEFTGRGNTYSDAFIGGFAETSNGYVTAYNYDSSCSTQIIGGDRDMYLGFVDKDLSNVKNTQISDGFHTSVPRLAPTGLDGGYVMWNGRVNIQDRFSYSIAYDNNLYYARYDANGNVGPVKLAVASLSDCAPIYWNGKVVWYVTNNSVPMFYTLDSNGVMPYQAQAGTGTTTPSTPTNIAYAKTQTVLLDGKSVEFQTYALKDSKGNLTNYVKLRDLAYYVNGTNAQFSVDWNAEQGISLTTGRPYAPNGSELSTPFSGDRAYKVGTGTTTVNSNLVDLASIVLTDNSGGAYTYYKLRDMGKALGFNVSYINGQIVVNTNEPYSDAQ